MSRQARKKTIPEMPTKLKNLSLSIFLAIASGNYRRAMIAMINSS
jgi:hypothetical protein